MLYEFEFEIKDTHKESGECRLVVVSGTKIFCFQYHVHIKKYSGLKGATKSKRQHLLSYCNLFVL